MQAIYIVPICPEQTGHLSTIAEVLVHLSDEPTSLKQEK